MLIQYSLFLGIRIKSGLSVLIYRDEFTRKRKKCINETQQSIQVGCLLKGPILQLRMYRVVMFPRLSVRYVYSIFISTLLQWNCFQQMRWRERSLRGRSRVVFAASKVYSGVSAFSYSCRLYPFFLLLLSLFFFSAFPSTVDIGKGRTGLCIACSLFLNICFEHCGSKCMPATISL